MTPGPESLSRGRARFELVTFDLDDTLYPEIDYVRSGFQTVAAHLASASGRDPEAIVERLWRHFRQGDRRRVFDAIVAEYDLAPRVTVPSLVELYRGHVPRIALRPGVREVFAALRGGGSRLAIVTDGPVIQQRRKAEALDLPRLVDAIVYTDELPPGCAKPSPAAFELLMRRFGVAGAACVYVADNPLKDFIGPRQLGWWTIQYLPEGGIHAAACPPPGGEPHATLRDLREVPRLLASPEA